MNLKRQLVTFTAVCIAVCVSSMPAFAEQSAAEITDSISKQVERIFAQADKLATQRKQRSKEYLSSLPDDGLAELYAKAMAPQQLPPSGLGSLAKATLEQVKKDRRKIVEQLLKYDNPLSGQDAEAFRREDSALVEQLAALGPLAVPALSRQLGEDHRRTGHWATANKALLKMGPDAVKPLILLMDNADSGLRANVAYVLSQIRDPRAKNVLVRAASDESGSVRQWAVQGLVKLGPEVVGKDKLVALLTDGLQDGTCLYESIRGLEQYGDETAIEALGVVERFYPGRGKADLRYFAREAIDSILRRAGQPIEEVPREHYSDKGPSHDELRAAAACANAGIRCSAIDRLGRYRDERTAMFLLDRWQQEQNPQVLNEIARTFCSLVTIPKGADTSEIPETVLQQAFDAFISAPETKPVLSTNILLACQRNGRIHDFIPPAGDKVLEAAVMGGRGMLNAAGNHEIELERVDRFKSLIRVFGLFSKDQSLRNTCYSAITTVAITSAKTAMTWSAQERNELQEQLSPLLDSPDPSIRLIECLGHIGDKRLVPRFIELLGHEDESVRRFAAHALGRLGDPRALPALERPADTDPHQYENGVYGVRKAAAEAIEKIQYKQANSSRKED